MAYWRMYIHFDRVRLVHPIALLFLPLKAPVCLKWTILHLYRQVWGESVERNSRYCFFQQIEGGAGLKL